MLFIDAQINRLFLACTKELSPQANGDWGVILKYIDRAYRQGKVDMTPNKL